MKKTIIFPFIAGMFLLLNACKNNNYKNATNAPPATDTTMANQSANTYNKPSPDTTKSMANPSTNPSKPMTKTETGKTTAKKKIKGRAYVSKTPMANTETKMVMDKYGVYNRAEIMPSYPGGEKALEEFVQDHIQYPQDAVDNN